MHAFVHSFVCPSLLQAIVPVVFFIIRVWGTLRIMISFTADSETAAAGLPSQAWMRILQAIFDPAQGFANAIIFVLLSKEDRHNIRVQFTSVLASCCVVESESTSTDFVTPFQSKESATHQSRRQQQVMSGNSIESNDESPLLGEESLDIIPPRHMNY